MNLQKFSIFFICFAYTLYGQTNFPYEINYKLFPASSGSFRFGMNGFENPASLVYVKNPDLYFLWNTGNQNMITLNDYGLFLALKNFGLGYYSQNLLKGRINNYKISTAFGDKTFSMGFGYQWSKTEIVNTSMLNLITIGTLFRPNKLLSIELIGTSDSKLKNYERVIDFAIRPFESEVLTLFSDYSYISINKIKKSSWSAGIVIEPLSGVQILTRYFNSKNFSLGLQLNFGHFSTLSSTILNKELKSIDQIYGLRIGSVDKNIIKKVAKQRKSYNLDLNGPIKYQKFQLFDKSKTLYELINKLEKIKNDESITQIEINTSGLTTSRVFLWELRDKLLELKQFGKKIIVYIDNADLNLYHLASVSDKIIMDPMGLIILEGVLMGRNYYKGTLEKLGLGFDELRFFRYKSSMETYSREKMSDADREQKQLIVDNLYSTLKNEIESFRKKLKLPVDSLVNNYVIFDSKQALEYGLIDSVGRWYELKDKSDLEKIFRVISSNTIETDVQNDYQWGEKPKIAIVYVIGTCAMDEGIKARSLIKEIEKVQKDNSIKAVVFRIDSPGGDGLASDIIAEAMKKLKKTKPVIVSQGLVAGSGGYWLSMYGDTIVSNKNTITGSIGVIGSWIYNKGFKESAGISTDYVKQGEHADIGFGMIIPLLNVVIPDRKLTSEERNKLEAMIIEMYNRFVNKVANGRQKSTDEIEKIAQGRVWSGKDAIKFGLVDVIGGLKEAIEIARRKANLEENSFEVIELPSPQLFDIDSLLPISINSVIEKNQVIKTLKFHLKNNGKPLMMMPVETLPDEFFIYDFIN